MLCRAQVFRLMMTTYLHRLDVKIIKSTVLLLRLSSIILEAFCTSSHSRYQQFCARPFRDFDWSGSGLGDDEIEEMLKDEEESTHPSSSPSSKLILPTSASQMPLNDEVILPWLNQTIWSKDQDVISTWIVSSFVLSLNLSASCMKRVTPCCCAQPMRYLERH